MEHVDQCLYGYRNGHQLLAASKPLPPEVRNRLLMLTDLSGPQLASGFETYLSGAPVSDREYALVRTWYAPEISRPGAVWSHVLLLSPDQLGLGFEAGIFAALLRRPTGVEADVESYRSPLELHRTSSRTAEADEVLENSPCNDKLREALTGGKWPIVLATAQPSACERPLLRFWSTLWPSARRTFRFCTGALSLRNESFDLQVVPPRILQARHSAVSGYLVDSAARSESKAAVHHPGGELGPLSKEVAGFVGECGEGLPLSKFAVLLQLSRLVLGSENSGPRPGEALNLLVSAFPRQNDGRALKRALLGVGPSASPYSLHVELADLVRSPAGTALDAEEIGLRQRVKELLSSESDVLSSLVELLGESSTPVAKEAIRAVFDELGIEGGARPKVCLSNRAALVLLKENVEVAVRPGFWTVADVRFADAWQVLRHAPDRTKLDAVGVFLSAGGPSRLGSVAEVDTESLQMAASWIDTLGDDASPWVEELAEVVGSRTSRLWDCATHAFVPQSVLWVLTALVRPTDKEVGRVEGWERLAETCPFGRPALKDRSDAFLFTIALRSRKGSEARLAIRRFEPLFERLARNQLDYRAWSYLSDELPGSWWEWDRCGRLVQAMARLMGSATIEVEAISESCQSDELFARLLSALAGERDLRKYFGELGRKARRSSTLSPERRRMIADADR